MDLRNKKKKKNSRVKRRDKKKLRGFWDEDTNSGGRVSSPRTNRSVRRDEFFANDPDGVGEPVIDRTLKGWPRVPDMGVFRYPFTARLHVVILPRVDEHCCFFFSCVFVFFFFSLFSFFFNSEL